MKDKARIKDTPLEDKTIEAGRILALKEAQKFLRDELGSDWNDLCKMLYEGRILAAMYKYKCSPESLKEGQIEQEQEELKATINEVIQLALKECNEYRMSVLTYNSILTRMEHIEKLTRKES